MLSRCALKHVKKNQTFDVPIFGVVLCVYGRGGGGSVIFYLLATRAGKELDEILEYVIAVEYIKETFVLGSLQNI